LSKHGHIATSLLAVAAIAAIAGLLIAGVSAGVHRRGCGGATDATYLASAFAVARQIDIGEHDGNAVKQALHTIESDRLLTSAVAAGDLVAVRSEVLALVYNHEHIVRLRVSSGGRVLDDFGGPLVLAPIRGVLRNDGALVGRFVMSIQDDAGYRKLAERLVGARVVITYRGRTLMSDIAAPRGALPERGAVTLAGRRFLVASFADGRFPTGTLRISLLFAAPPSTLALSSCAEVRADVLANVALRAYRQSLSGPQVLPALTTLALDRALPQALAAGDDAGTETIVRGIVKGGGFAMLRVFVAGRLVASARSTPYAVTAPLRRRIRDSAGTVVGVAQFAVQTVWGYVSLAQELSGAAVLVRAGARQLAGTFAGPRRLPASGFVSYRGKHYAVASFRASSYPDGPIRIYVLTAS
jgi:hypothetical protein